MKGPDGVLVLFNTTEMLFKIIKNVKKKKTKKKHSIHIIVYNKIHRKLISRRMQQAYYNILRLIYLQSDHNIDVLFYDSSTHKV